MMDNTKEISRHCTVLQPRSYSQSSIPFFLHVYVDLGGTVTDNKIVVLALLLHRRPVGLFEKASVLERPSSRKLSGNIIVVPVEFAEGALFLNVYL